MPGVSVSGNTITFQITDGGLGDDDLTVNGVVVDDGGAVIADPNAMSIPSLGQKGLILLGVLLAGIGVLGVGRRNCIRLESAAM